MMSTVFALDKDIRAGDGEPNQPVQGAALPHDRVLLFADGGVLTGNITQAEDRYIVTSGGAEISVPAANVVTVCESLEAAYLYQQRTMQGSKADARIALANWCLQNGLHHQSAAELSAAREIDAKHPKLELLERRLAVVGRPAPSQHPTAVPAKTPPDQVGTTNPLSIPAGELPDGVVERFTRRVQPMLVNNCTMAGCHRPGGGQSFALDRASLHGMGNRRTTMNNLAAVLALVDRERPQESPLLTIGRRDHGGMNRPIFGPRQSPQFQQLVDWVAMVTKSAASAEVEPVTRVSYENVKNVQAPSRPKQATIGSGGEKSADASGTAEELPPFMPAPLKYGARARAWQPKDPFDPEIFNRQTQKAAQQQATESSHD